MIPFTLQPVAVLLAGAVLGARLGAASQALYLAAGIVGASMFAWSPVLLPGAARLLGPTGGFLMAFPVAAFVTGLMSERGLTRHYAGAVLAMLAGAAALYAGGIAWAMVTLPGASFAAFLPSTRRPISSKVLLMAAAVPALRRAFARARRCLAWRGRRLLTAEHQEMLERQERLAPPQHEAGPCGVAFHVLGRHAFVRIGPRARRRPA